MLGKGSYGCVFKGKCKKTGQPVALKMMKDSIETEYDFIKTLREIQIMRALNQFSVDVLGETVTPELIEIIRESETELNQICLVMEYVRSDLELVLKHKIDFSMDHLLKIVYNLLIGLAFLHNANIIHRDIKPGNLLITADCKVKICDFGLARCYPVNEATKLNLPKEDNKNADIWRRLVDRNQKVAEYLISDRPRRAKLRRSLSLHVSSRWYRAPEISMMDKSYDLSSDLWSVGCIIYELIQYVQHTDHETFPTEFKTKRHAFQGDSCFPLSPCEKIQKKGMNTSGKMIVSRNDQLKIIINKLGLQTESDLSYLSNQ